jgi:hypothetical protein
MRKPQLPTPLTVTAFGEKAFKEVIMLKQGCWTTEGWGDVGQRIKHFS